MVDWRAAVNATGQQSEVTDVVAERWMANDLLVGMAGNAAGRLADPINVKRAHRFPGKLFHCLIFGQMCQLASLAKNA